VITTMRRMLTCHWSARRIQRYLDADPGVRLSAQDARRLEAHLAICEKCTELAQEHRRLRTALSRWSARRMPNPEAVARMHAVVDRIVDQDGGAR
jgi:anti-sigma factor RsiW